MNPLDSLVKFVNDGLCDAYRRRLNSDLPIVVPGTNVPTLEQVKHALVLRAMEAEDSNATNAAQRVGMSKSAFYRHPRKYGIKFRHA